MFVFIAHGTNYPSAVLIYLLETFIASSSLFLFVRVHNFRRSHFKFEQNKSEGFAHNEVWKLLCEHMNN